MGNAQKKPHGRGDGGGGARGGKGASADKYSVSPPEGEEGASKGKGLANGNNAHHGPKGGKEQTEPTKVNLDAPAGNLPPPLARLKNEGNHLFKNGQFGDAIEKYTLAIDGYAEAGSIPLPPPPPTLR